MGIIINFPTIENQEQENNEEDQYKEYYYKFNEHDEKIFELEQYISDEELAIIYFKREQSKLQKMVEDMKKELIVKRKELKELKKNYIMC